MTEAEWLASDDPAQMLASLWRLPHGVKPNYCQAVISDRKLRLFACACCRITESMQYPEAQEVVRVAEEQSDLIKPSFARLLLSARQSIDAIRGWFWCVTCADIAIGLRQTLVEEAPGYGNANGPYIKQMAALLRDIVGNLFQPLWPTARPYFSKLTRENATVRNLAQAAYDERQTKKCETCKGRGGWREEPAFDTDETTVCSDCHGTGRTSDGTLDPDRLAVLADALEDAGCDNVDILSHLRGQEKCPNCTGESDCIRVYCQTCEGSGRMGWIPLRGPHVRGCWCLDMILGKE